MMWERKCIHIRSDIQYDHQIENILNKYSDWQLVGVVPMEAGKFKYMAFMQRQKTITGGVLFEKGFSSGGQVKGKETVKK